MYINTEDKNFRGNTNQGFDVNTKMPLINYSKPDVNVIRIGN